MLAYAKCQYRFRHERRPRSTCDRPVVGGPAGDGLCVLHQPRILDAAMLRSELEQALRDGDHWLEGIVVEEADLTGIQAVRAQLPHASFQGSNLSDAALPEAVLDHANLRSADLRHATLSRSSLNGANLAGANLCDARLDRTVMRGTNCEGALAHGTYLFGAELSAQTSLLDVDVRTPGELQDRNYLPAAQVFRDLAAHFQSRADYRRSDDCYYYAMRATHCLEGGPGCRLSSRIYWALHRSVWGYGVRPLRALAWAATVILLFGLWIFPLTGIRDTSGISHKVWDGMALSVVTFTTLGYGNRTPASVTGEFIAGLEALSGAVLTSIFLVALATKYVRRG